MMTEDEGAGRHDTFVSYSRSDREVVVDLVEGLTARGKRCWVDLEDIPPSAEWMAEIRRAIEGADGYLVVISPDLATSKVCAEELELARAGGKRIVPLLVRATDPDTVPAMLASLNWIDAMSAPLEGALDDVVLALDTDLDYVHSHTRLLVQASDWERGGGRHSQLLRGEDLADAERFLVLAQDKEPRPTPGQARFIQASRQATSQRQRRGIAGVAVGLVAALVLSGVALVQRSEARRQRATAIEQRDLAQSTALSSASASELDVDPELSLLLALEAADIRRTPQVEEALRASIKASNIAFVFEGHDDEVNDLTYAPDGSWIASASDDGTIQIWDPATGQNQTTISYSNDPEARIFALTTDPAGRVLASAGQASDITIWNVPDGERILDIRPPDDGFVYTLSFSPNGERLASAGGGSVDVWDVETGRPVTEFAVPGGAYGASYGPDGDVIASAGGDGVVRLWDADSASQIRAFRGHEGLAFGVAFSPDGTRLVSSAEDRVARVWDVETGAAIAVLPQEAPLNDAAFVRGNEYMVTIDSEGVGRVWSVTTGEVVSRLLGHGAWMSYVAYDPGTDRIATSSVDGTVRLWRPGEGVSKVDITRADYTWGARYSPDGSKIALSGGSGQGGIADTVSVVDANDGSDVMTLTMPDPEPAQPDEVGGSWFFPDGGTVVSVGVERGAGAAPPIGVVQTWDVDSGDPVDTLRVPSGALPYSVDVSDDGSRLVATTSDGETRIWDVESGEIVAELEGGNRPLGLPGGAKVFGAAFDPKDELVATSDAATAVLWDPTADEVVQRFEGHEGDVSGIGFSPDGRLLVTGSFDQTARIWDVETGAQLRVLRGHQNEVTDAAFDTTGAFVVTAAVDGTARVWDIEGDELHRYAASEFLVTSAGFSPDGGSVLLSTADQISLAVAGLPSREETSGKARVFDCDLCRTYPDLLELGRSRVTRELTAEERAIYLGGSAP
jgi:WD40 repeat protein